MEGQPAVKDKLRSLLKVKLQGVEVSFLNQKRLFQNNLIILQNKSSHSAVHIWRWNWNLDLAIKTGNDVVIFK